MGTFRVEIEITNPVKGIVKHTEALVDTGATHTMLPGNFLKELDISPIDSIPFQLADNRVVEYDVGEIRLQLDGRERTVLVVFGPDDVLPLIGATTLEVFNLGVDPVRKQLIPVTALLKMLPVN
jgi:clan AA aspartic protease